MATLGQSVTRTPTALVGIVAGRYYSLQNVTAAANSCVYISIQTAAPNTGTNAAFVLGRKECAQAAAAAGESIFIWQLNDCISNIAYEQVE